MKRSQDSSNLLSFNMFDIDFSISEDTFKYFWSFGFPLLMATVEPIFGLSMVIGALIQREYFFRPWSSKFDAATRNLKNNTEDNSFLGLAIDAVSFIGANTIKPCMDIYVEKKFNEGIVVMLMAQAAGLALSIALPVSFVVISFGLLYGAALSRCGEELLTYKYGF